MSEANVNKPKIISGINLLKKTLLVYKGKFDKIIGLYLILVISFIPLLIIRGIFLFSDYFIPDNFTIQKIFSIILILLFVFFGLFFLYTNILIQISILLLLKKTGELKVKDIFKKSIKYFWPFLLVNLVMIVFIFLWSLLFIIPGIIFSFYYIFAIYTLIFDEYKSTATLKRSRELVKNYWWAVVGRVLVLVIFFWLALFLLSFPLWFIDQSSKLFMIYNNFIDLLIFVLSPIATIYYYFLYKDLVKIKGESKIINKNPKKSIIIWLISLFGILIIILFIFSLFILKSDNSQVQIRDGIRLKNVEDIQTALDNYKNKVGTYPNNLNFGETLAYQGEVFMATVPENPLPSDGDCPKGFEYIYSSKDSGSSYELTFCLGRDNEDLASGLYILNPEK